jgi:hypothetical protein
VHTDVHETSNCHSCKEKSLKKQPPDGHVEVKVPEPLPKYCLPFTKKYAELINPLYFTKIDMLDTPGGVIVGNSITQFEP